MVDNGSDTARPPVSPAEPARRAHTYSRLTTAIAVLGLATAAYALLRLDTARDRLEQVNDMVRKLEGERSLLQAELGNLAAREQRATRELDRRLDALDDTPRQMQELASSLEELRGRAEGPERAWSRAEAMFLIELAQRRLTLERDVETAIVALESADARLASLRDQTFAAVRQQIVRELQALRAVRRADATGILATLASAEKQVMQLPVKGIVASERKGLDGAELPEGMLPRAWSILRNAMSNLVVVRKVDDDAGSVVTRDEALLRRQHLQLLLFSARTSVARHDTEGYRSALSAARRWLGEFFDLSSPAARALLEEIQVLEPIDIDPPLPDLSGSLRALQRTMPARREPG